MCVEVCVCVCVCMCCEQPVNKASLTDSRQLTPCPYATTVTLYVTVDMFIKSVDTLKPKQCSVEGVASSIWGHGNSCLSRKKLLQA